MSEQRDYFSEKNNKTLLARFELASSIILVLGLAHYTTADDIVVVLLL